MRNGIDVAKAVALGADSVGIAGPLVRAAAAGDEVLEDTVAVIVEELRLAMFCVGAASVSATAQRRTPGALRGPDGPMTHATMSLDAADAYCRQLVRHYENFTVASRLSPRSLRQDLTRVYAFCRYTDDLGDESGDRAVATRRLRRWRDETRESFEHDERTHPVLVALADSVRRHRMDAQPFVDLIDANLQDQRVDVYEDWPALRGVLQAFSRTGGTHRAAALRHRRGGCGGIQRRRLHRTATRQLRPGRHGWTTRLGRTYLIAATSASTASTEPRG